MNVLEILHNNRNTVVKSLLEAYLKSVRTGDSYAVYLFWADGHTETKEWVWDTTPVDTDRYWIAYIFEEKRTDTWDEAAETEWFYKVMLYGLWQEIEVDAEFAEEILTAEREADTKILAETKEDKL